MDELLARALETARLKGARYADARLVSTKEQGLAVKNGAVDGLTSSESAGVGVRVLVGQAWGFASSRGLTAAEVLCYNPARETCGALPMPPSMPLPCSFWCTMLYSSGLSSAAPSCQPNASE